MSLISFISLLNTPDDWTNVLNEGCPYEKCEILQTYNREESTWLPSQDITEECHEQTSHKVKGPDQIVYLDK